MDFTPLTILALSLVATAAGLVDAIAGGGGLIMVPALMATGLPNVPNGMPLVFGTNKGAAVFGSGAALLRFYRARLIDTGKAPLLFVLGFVGSLGGAFLLTVLDPKILRPLVLNLLIIAGFVVAFARPKPSATSAPTLVMLKAGLLAAVLGAYDGFFGPGTGTFLIIGFVTLIHFSLQQASANAKVVNFASNLAAMLLFALKGLVIWKVSIPMAVGQFIGGTIGAQLAVKGGNVLVRRVVLLVVICLVLKLSYDQWGT